jgi:hypothetical protein
MLKPMTRVIALLLLLYGAVAVAAADSPLQITAAEWAQPHSGQWLLRQPALVEAVHQLQAKHGAVLEIRYPGGDDGSLWARELQAWLVALGIESARIRLLPGSDAADLLQLRVR